MEHLYDREAGGKTAAKTRVYAPTRKDGGFDLLSADTPQARLVQPQPTEADAAPIPVVRKEPLPMTSKVLLILSMFLMAGTAIIGLSGSATLTAISSDIAEVESDITTYEENISQLKKEQNALNDYNSINDVNRGAGRIMIWDIGE